MDNREGPVPANIEEGVDAARPVPDHEEGIAGHLVANIFARFGELVAVRDEKP